MDEELTDGYHEPCPQCLSVDWGVSDAGQFFCRFCHNVIERVLLYEDAELLSTSSRVSSLSRASIKKRRELHRNWIVIEGFQFVLLHQAEALVSMGVCSQFKDDILYNFWKRYLQATNQAYTRAPLCYGEVEAVSDFTSESECPSELSFQSEPSLRGRRKRTASGSSGSVVSSGSMDGSSYSKRKSGDFMTMPRTLALCYLALLWVREGITLSDLLRFASEKHLPYINVHEYFPEEMTVFGRDCQYFKVESIPSYSHVHKDILKLARIMKLPAFPPVTPDCLLHPSLLSLRYLVELNLPDELHHWLCKVIKQANMAEQALLTFDYSKRPIGTSHFSYDLQACALIIVTMKLLFRLDDSKEWKLSKIADFADPDAKQYSLAFWHTTMHKALVLARKREKLHTANQQWKSSKPFILSERNKSVFLKRRRVVEYLQTRFQKLSGQAVETEPTKPSSFIFLWGDGEDSDGPSLHCQKLDCNLKKRRQTQLCANKKYWHPLLRPCNPT
ncbi:TATA box-binding protein-associated factor RNA polymerase I subunit B-like isoform X2 [Denticeps clupeoides]|nr:TATA box-binding protein-associated factor RNA polymerase I subunit B isoform X2 [Denticeps clupeoides]